MNIHEQIFDGDRFCLSILQGSNVAPDDLD